MHVYDRWLLQELLHLLHRAPEIWKYYQTTCQSTTESYCAPGLVILKLVATICKTLQTGVGTLGGRRIPG